MNDSSDYLPPKVWTWNKASGGQFASINRPIAGATQEKDLPVANSSISIIGPPNATKLSSQLKFQLYDE